MDWEAIEHLDSFLMDQVAVEKVFQEGKNTDMNAIKHAIQPNIQTTFKALKIISQQEKCQTQRSKTHTHIKQV